MSVGKDTPRETMGDHNVVCDHTSLKVLETWPEDSQMFRRMHCKLPPTSNSDRILVGRETVSCESGY